MPETIKFYIEPMSFTRTKFRDIQLDSGGDLKIANGDFVLDLSDQQHIEHIVESWKGNWRETPAVGVGIIRYLNHTRQVTKRGELLRKIRLQLEYDNYQINKLNLTGNLLLEGQQGIEIDAFRIK